MAATQIAMQVWLQFVLEPETQTHILIKVEYIIRNKIDKSLKIFVEIDKIE